VSGVTQLPGVPSPQSVSTDSGLGQAGSALQGLDAGQLLGGL
jgi:hypothetical protein